MTRALRQRKPAVAAPPRAAPRSALLAANPAGRHTAVPGPRHLPGRPAAAAAARNTDPDRLLKIALGASILIHVLALSVRFGFPDAPRLLQDKLLEVVLVNSKTKERPRDAQALAQTHLDGGGNTDENRRARTPLPASRQQKEGSQLESSQQRVKELEVRQRTMLAQMQVAAPAVPQSTPTEVQPETPREISGLDLAANALAMARLQAQIERDLEAYNKRPRKKFIGARTEEYRFAQYVEDWRLKVERIGTLNYPDAARGRVYGSLVLTVILQPDGSVARIEIDRSSGHRVLDDAARRIVQMASPYAAFPPDIRRDTDELAITRTWFFTRDDQVRAN